MRTTTIRPTDLCFEDSGSLFLLRPCNDEARVWIIEHTDDAESQWFGDALVVEPRYLHAILNGALDAGLVVRRG